MTEDDYSGAFLVALLCVFGVMVALFAVATLMDWLT